MDKQEERKIEESFFLDNNFSDINQINIKYMTNKDVIFIKFDMKNNQLKLSKWNTLINVQGLSLKLFNS